MLAVQRALVWLKLRKVTRFAIISLHLVNSVAAPEAVSNSEAMRPLASAMCDPGTIHLVPRSVLRSRHWPDPFLCRKRWFGFKGQNQKRHQKTLEGRQACKGSNTARYPAVKNTLPARCCAGQMINRTSNSSRSGLVITEFLSSGLMWHYKTWPQSPLGLRPIFFSAQGNLVYKLLLSLLS